MLHDPRNNMEHEVPAAPDRQGMIRGLSRAGFHRIAFTEWGRGRTECPVVCVHGLTRQGRDFDFLADRLAKARRHVVCPDLPGRGRSGRLANPDEYELPQYCADMNALIAHFGAKEVDWVGTSLGGLIGMVLAGLPGNPIRRIVINDIGPFVGWSGLSRIGRYVADMPVSFPTIDKAESYFRTIHATYGELPDRCWRHLTEHSVSWNEERQHYATLCDPAIAVAFRTPWYNSLDLWKYWEAIRVPILVLHGSKSDLLTADLTREMVNRNRRATVHRFPECGHVPPLMAAHQLDVIEAFLAEGTRRRRPGARA